MVSVLVEHLLKQRIVSPEDMRKIGSIEFFEANDTVHETSQVLKMIKEK